MFRRARIKLTVYYSAIIMAISIFFSIVIYKGAAAELDRIQRIQMLRRPPSVNFIIDLDVLEETKQRIIFALVALNGVILAVSALGGYFMAGRTLAPIAKNMEEQKKFVSDASHELRTPLTSLKTEIEVGLRDKALDLAEAKRLLTSNLEEVDKMQTLSNYLLSLNRYESGRELALAKVDLKEIALKAIGKKKVKKDLKKSVVVGNRDSLVELATILLDNAFKYGGGKTVEIRTGGGTLEVEDHGGGIAKEDLPHIFDRFFRSDKSRGTEGYGLGLSIAKSIVDAHGGRINVVSKVGKGSVFKVNFD